MDFNHVKDSKKHPYNNPQTIQLVCRNDPVGLSEQSNWIVITPQLDCRAPLSCNVLVSDKSIETEIIGVR